MCPCTSYEYKQLTACLARKIYELCKKCTILAEKQKGCVECGAGFYGCKKQIPIDEVIIWYSAEKKNRNIIYTTPI